ncbi:MULTISPECIES: hypothetical protein [Salinibaculum]|uniref:hypothetical protein n=1 Tax=Salinibaculum TaxID=2732368 RepID=UPI0030CDE492
MSKFDFDAVEQIGEVHPDYVGHLLRHRDTRIEVHHGDTCLMTIEDPTKSQVARPRIHRMNGRKQVSFKLSAVVEWPRVDVSERLDDVADDAKTTDDTDDDVEGGDNEDDEDDYEDHMTFTLGDGPADGGEDDDE